MLENIQGNELYILQSLLIRKNREFTDGMRLGKKHQELVSLYDEIKRIYDRIFQMKMQTRFTDASITA